jgi:hypothetical protein
MTLVTFLDDLAAATNAAESAEAAFRREAAARIAALEGERAFAYRRLNWMRAVAETVTGTEDEENAIAHVRAALRTRLGWHGDDAGHEAVLERFSDVARAAFACLTPGQDEDADVAAALPAFETWYQQTHGRSFWALFEHYIPETPLVDF